MKQSFLIRGWNWVGNPITDQSYLGYFFDVYAGSDQDYYVVGNNSLDSGYLEVQAHNVTLRQSLDRIAMLDGVIRFKRYNTYGGLKLWSPGDPLMASGGMTSCYPSADGLTAQAVQFQQLDYDPQFSVIFGQVDSPQAPSSSPSARKSKTAAIIGASVAAAIVGIAVVGVILAAIFIPSFRNWIRPFASRAEPHTRIPSVSKERAQQESGNGNGSGWVKAVKGPRV